MPSNNGNRVRFKYRYSLSNISGPGRPGSTKKSQHTTKTRRIMAWSQLEKQVINYQLAIIQREFKARVSFLGIEHPSIEKPSVSDSSLITAICGHLNKHTPA